MVEIANIEVKAPVKIGQVIKDDLIGTGVSLVATRNVKRTDSKHKNFEVTNYMCYYLYSDFSINILYLYKIITLRKKL